MKLLFSIPTGYHLRELVMPLHDLLEQDENIEKIFCITPGAEYPDDVFPTYSDKFEFIKNPETIEKHKILFNKLEPNLVITNTVGHDELDYPILKSAQELNIKTLTFIASWDNVWKIRRLINDNKPIAIADTVIVWNNMMKEHFKKLFPDFNSTNLHVIGSPRLDYFTREDKIPSKQELYKHLGLTDITRPLIHFATTELYPLDYTIKAIRHAIDKKQIKQNPYIYASVHPGGDMTKHESLKQYDVTIKYSFGRKDNAKVKAFSYNPTPKDLYMLVSLFKHTNVLVNHSSTAALESIIANTPVVNVQYGKPWNWIGWYRSMVRRDFEQHYTDLTADGATTIVRNKHELIHATDELLENPNINKEARIKTMNRMITTTDGTASNKVLEKIKESATS